MIAIRLVVLQVVVGLGAGLLLQVLEGLFCGLVLHYFLGRLLHDLVIALVLLQYFLGVDLVVQIIILHYLDV